MSLQYLAEVNGIRRIFAALRPHAPVLPAFGCDLADIPAILCANGLRVIRQLGLRLDNTQISAGFKNKFRRQQCLRASSLSHWLACWPPLQPALSRKKSLSWLSPSRWSQHTPANTSNDQKGPALWPVPAAPRGAGQEAPLC